jgi:predicted permease
MFRLWIRGLWDAVRTAGRERRSGGSRWRVRLFGGLGGDLRSAFSASRRAPGFSLTVILTLALGIGLAAAIFAFADGYLFRPLPYGNPEELYLVRAPDARGEFLRASEAEALRTSPVGHYGFVDGARSSPVGFATLRLDDRDVRVRFSGVGEGYGQVTRVALVIGRRFRMDEHRGVEPVPVWLSHRFWMREFGGDRDVLGRRFSLSTAATAGSAGGRQMQVEIVGVTDPAVTTFNPNFGAFNSLPDGFAPALPREPDSGRYVTLATPVVRLPPGVPRHRAEAEIAAALQTINPAKNGAPRMVRLDSLQDEHVKAGRPTAVLLLTGAGLALALVTVNLVHLLLTRGVGRAREIATRAALGATRWRLGRLFLVESLLHGVAGVTAGLLLRRWLTLSLAANIPTRGTDTGTLALVTMSFDARVMAFAIVAGLITALLGGAWPAWRASRLPLVAAARTQSGAGPRISARLSRAILASEVAVSTIVLTGAVFAGIGIWRYLNQPLGYDLTDRFSVSFPAMPGQVAGGAADWPAVRRAVAGVTGVRAASAVWEPVRGEVRVGDRLLDERTAYPIGIGPTDIEAMGLHLLTGRTPTPVEAANLAAVALVDARFARLAWPDASPLGKQVDVGGVAHAVIGVVQHPRFSLMRDTPPVLLVPAADGPDRKGMTVWAPGLTEAALTERLAAVLEAVAPGYQPNVSARSFDREFADDIANVRFQRPIVLVLGAFAFTVAGIGLFGLVAYLVEQRTRDFGIQLALGARPAVIWRDLARESLGPSAIGLTGGVAGALGLAGIMRAGMSGWESSMPLSIAVVSGLVFGVAVLAVVAPARRAVRIDPAITLRAI